MRLSTEVCVFATYGFGDDNKYFELQQLDADAALEVAPVQLTCVDPISIGARAPVVLSIAPDEVDCDDPDDPDNVEDVQIAGLCFFNDIDSAFLTLNPDGSGTQIPLSNVIHVATNIVTATVPLAQLTQRDTPYYVFVVRGDGVRSTNYPNPFGFDVTFTCVSTVVPSIRSDADELQGRPRLGWQVRAAGQRCGLQAERHGRSAQWRPVPEEQVPVTLHRSV